MNKYLSVVIIIAVLFDAAFQCGKEKERMDFRKEKSDAVGGACACNETSAGDSEMLIIDYDLTFDGGIRAGKVRTDEVAVKTRETEA